MVVENNHKFDAAVLPAELVNTALFLGHNQSGHNGFQRTYAAIKRIYYWKGMHKDILKILQRLFTVHKTSGGEEKVHRTILQTLVHNPWNSFPWTWLVNSTHRHQKGTNMHLQLSVC